MTSLALFDIDGTILDSNEFDAACYVDAVREILHIDAVDVDWSKYRHVTDTGILMEIYGKQFGREIPPDLVATVRERFVEAVHCGLKDQRMIVRRIRGVNRALEALKDHRWLVSFATGGWRESSEAKLQYAGIERGRYDLFSSNDDHRREEIIRLAIEKAGGDSNPGRFDRIVYIGDGIWDLQACRKMGICFLGMGRDHSALLRNGATHALADYEDSPRFFSSLRHCGVPA
jgi:phosphoglycolate phosphatase-like HAD superfamily hydrolase